MMNTYNNGTAALKMPSSYVPMGTEEMEYVDGGSEGTYRKQAAANFKAQMAKLTPAQRAALERKVKIAMGGYCLAVLSGVSYALSPIVGGIVSGCVIICGYTYTVATV